MGNNYGNGVSRVLDPTDRSFLDVIFQQGKPPLDSEFTLLQDLVNDWRRIHVLRSTPSGWLGNVTNARESFLTNPTWSNWFRLGQQRTGEKDAHEWAVVNGWLIPVTGTKTGTPPGSPNDTDTWNRITLDPPPANSGDARIDFVFLEAWLAKVAPQPSATNKPSTTGIWKYGNVEGGYSFLADDLQDTDLGFETSQRVQVQYRVRVVPGLLGLATYPDGFDPTLVKGQGTAASQTSFVFTNMRQELGDPGLWRAGDGTANALGTVDGYTYAIPLCAVFRRNRVAWDGDPSQNLNGGFNRNPTAVDRTGWKTFSTVPSLNADLNSSALSLTLVSAANIPLPLAPASAVAIQIDDEIMTYSVITGTTMTLVDRGAFGTRAESHKAGATIKVLSGRPDGLFSDQVAKTDILDLRHVVNPNGYDYDSLLRSNLDKLLRGELRANWKRSGGGPQGAFVFYQDKISNSAAALGVTKLDGPDNIRMTFSDASVLQPVEAIVDPTAASVAWGLSLNYSTTQGVGNQFNNGDTITIPINQFKTGIPGSDTDQIRLLGNSDGAGAVTVRIDGNPRPLVLGTDYTISSPGPSNDLVITLAGGFPAATTRRLYITVHVLYGPGRGLSRRPDSIHSIAYISSGSDIMAHLAGVPNDNVPLRAAWMPLWSKFRNATYKGLLPVTAEAYADPGSRSIVLTPFRKVDLPDQTRTLDGANININTGHTVASGNTGVGDNTITFNDAGGDFVNDGVVVGDALVVTAPAAAVGTYIVTNNVAATSFDVDRAIPNAANVVYTIHHTQGMMPLNNLSGAVKWTTTDPLGLFNGTTDPTAAAKDIYLPLPRHLAPSWGEVRVPIVHSDTTTIPPGGSATFDEGVNFLVLNKKGLKAVAPNSERNYVPYSNGALSYAPFSTKNLVTSNPATYNTTFAFGGNTFAGMRFFTDTRGLGRQGLELPPFYGVARLFAVYEAQDYAVNGSAYDANTRQPTGAGATNLLRQNMTEATFWIEKDADGDSTFILNAEAIELGRSPNPIASFSAGHYVIEATIFGFDRGSFDRNQGFRLALTRERAASQAANGMRTNNFGTGANASIDSPDLVIPGPALAADEIVVNYSRTPYQGDAWGTQTVQTDIGHKPGPMTTASLFQITSTSLDEAALSRPNQKPLEVLSAVGFATTLGTGRISGDQGTGFDIRNVGWEQFSASFPPATALDPRPGHKIGALTTEEGALDLGTEYHGCTERLPLGSFFRDKDFRGTWISGAQDQNFQSQVQAPLAHVKDRGPATIASAVMDSQSLEQDELVVNTVSLASGQPGEFLVHVDGEQGNYALLTNFRTNRGGSVFSASSPRPGGEFATVMTTAGSHPSDPTVLCGVACLVRNTVTTAGTELSAGGELMMLVVTSGVHLDDVNPTQLQVKIGTNGTHEGYSAADLYRIEGRPLERDNVRAQIDPATIALSKADS